MEQITTRYWTAFADPTDPNQMHCTHKYLGDLTEEQVSEVISLIFDFFDAHAKTKKQKWNFPMGTRFDREEFFDVDNSVRVLLASEGTEELIKNFDPLRKSLDKFRADDWIPYRPHISSPDKPRIYALFTRYVLMQDKDVLFSAQSIG